MKKVAVIQSSLRINSHTSIVCDVFIEKAKVAWLIIEYIDLREIHWQFCDGRELEKYNDDVNKAYETLTSCDAIVFGMPVYQYTMSWVLKNFIDICGASMMWKEIGIIVNSGWPNCYMASRDLFDALYYEYGTKNISPTPFSWSMDFKDWRLVNSKVVGKIEELVGKITLSS